MRLPAFKQTLYDSSLALDEYRIIPANEAFPCVSTDYQSAQYCGTLSMAYRSATLDVDALARLSLEEVNITSASPQTIGGRLRWYQDDVSMRVPMSPVAVGKYDTFYSAGLVSLVIACLAGLIGTRDLPAPPRTPDRPAGPGYAGAGPSSP